MPRIEIPHWRTGAILFAAEDARDMRDALAERWFLAIRPGMIPHPEYNQVAYITERFIVEWMEERDMATDPAQTAALRAAETALAGAPL
jgi:hypothetical protein